MIYADLEKAMQNSVAASKNVACPINTTTNLVYRNKRRLALVILPDKVNTITVWHNGNGSGGTAGAVPNTSGGVFITMKDYGDLVRAQWDAQGQTATCNVTVVEVLASYDPDTE